MTAAQSALQRESKRICVVEDDDDLRESIVAAIHRSGFQTVDFSNASAALEELRHQSCDCVLSDISMPGMSGFEFFSIARADGMETPWLFMSGNAMFRHAVPTGAKLLVKPFSTEELITELTMVMTLS